MTLETINNLKILAEEVMITALADYDYYTKNGDTYTIATMLTESEFNRNKTKYYYIKAF